MLNALASEFSNVLGILESFHAVEHFTFTMAASRVPLAPAVVALLSSLLSAVEDCHAGLEGLICELPTRQALIHYSQAELLDSHSALQLRLERQERIQTQSGSVKEEYRLESSVKCSKNEDVPTTSVELLNHATYSCAPSPECLEALNLSVAASPECLEAINLSVATSPCYNPVDESVSVRDSLKTLNDDGASNVFWDHVNLDVGNPADCFGSVNLPVSVANQPSDGLNLEFAHDIDSTSALGDNYMLDISSHVSVTDALNAYFSLQRDAHEIAPQKTSADSDASLPLQTFQLPAAALDLSLPGLGPLLVPQVSQNHPVHLVNNFTTVSEEEENPKTAAETFVCAECGKVVRTKGSLRRHQEAHGAGGMICDHCGKAFHSVWLLRRHVLAHVSSHVCEICGKRCVDQRKLRRHVATHSAGTFSCSACRKCFSRADGLKRHMDIMHLKSREFSCRLCSRTFSVKCNLLSHIDSVHGGESIQCDVCGKRCKNKDSFRSHARLHAAPAQACVLCGRSFHRLAHYRRHMKNQHSVKDP